MGAQSGAETEQPPGPGGAACCLLPGQPRLTPGNRIAFRVDCVRTTSSALARREEGEPRPRAAPVVAELPVSLSAIISIIPEPTRWESSASGGMRMLLVVGGIPKISHLKTILIV